MKRLALGLLITLFIGVSAQAQSSLKLDQSESSLIITGTSTLHDWEIDVEEYSGFVQVNSNDGNASIASGELHCVVESFNSGKSKMDKVVYDALEYKDHPNIKFNYLRTINNSLAGEQLNVVAEGELTIAGVTRTIEVEMQSTYRNGFLQLEGSKSFNMSLFEVDPPSVMFGTIKSGDKVTIDYSLKFHQ